MAQWVIAQFGTPVLGVLLTGGVNLSKNSIDADRNSQHRQAKQLHYLPYARSQSSSISHCIVWYHSR